MNNKFFSIVFSVILMGTFGSCWMDHNINVSINDSKESYHFSAHFPNSKSDRVQGYINQQIEPNSLLKASARELEGAIVLNDQTTFDIKASTGRLVIDFDKTENSAASYARVKKMCEGVKVLLTKD